MESSPLNQALNFAEFDSPTLQGIDTFDRDRNRLGGSSKRQMVRFFKETTMEVQTTRADVLKDRTGQFVESTKILERKAVPVTKEMVEIVTPGDKNVVYDRAQDFHKLEHFDVYRAYREGRTAPIGMPIEDCKFISGPIALELRVHKVFTVEQLADASDDLCRLIPNGWELREFSRAEVRANKESARGGEILTLKSEISESKATIEQLKAQISSLVDQFGQPVVTEPKRKRAPRKQVVTEESVLVKE